MEPKENLQGIYRRLQKLLAIAGDSRGDPAECAAAASMAEKIMRKYQIEESEVLEKQLKAGDAGLFSFYDVGASFNQGRRVKGGSSALSQLAVPIARLNDCQAVFKTDDIFGKMIRFRGFHGDVMVCKFTFRHILSSCVRSSEANRIRPTHLSDFRKGYVKAVIEALNLAIQEKQAEMQAQVNSRALVIIKKDAVALHFGEVKYGHGSTNVNNRDAYERGHAEGSKLNATIRGVTHNGVSQGALK